MTKKLVMPTYYINENGKLVVPLLQDTDHTDYVLIEGNLVLMDEVSGEVVES